MQNEDGKKSKEKKETPELKGTFISVMLLGVFLILSWIGAFALFISR